MKKITKFKYVKNLMFFLILITSNSSLYSQIRYVDEIFENYYVESDVVYGNAPDLPFWFLVESNTVDIDLKMDLYFPEGDTELDRPVIIIAHGGAFFSGNNDLDDVSELSIAAVKRGYVVANINYRLGLNILDGSTGERAVFRAMQDGSAAIRFLKEYSTEYSIDPDKVYFWGTSAGSFIALHLAYTDNEDRPASTYGGFSAPDLGCLDCEGNIYDHDSRPNAIVSCWGAIGDLSWIDENDYVPSLLFHGTSDPVVPFGSGLPFTLLITLPVVHGSSVISERLSLHNISHQLVAQEGELHEYWGAVNGNFIGGEPSIYWDSILNTGFQFLYNQFSNEFNGDINFDGSINILDVVMLVNIILGLEGSSYQFDLNSDNSMDILDIIILVNQILE